jgi:acyl-homoserine-lactone acylase
MQRCLLTLALLTALFTSSAAQTRSSEILWDSYGTPHIFAATREAMFYAHGWAQMEHHANLLLRLYGESRGRAAEYWGGDANLQLDRWIQLNSVPERAKQWYDAQDATFRRYLDEFARGINAYGAAHGDTIDPRVKVVLPVSGVDVVGHSHRAVHFMYMAGRTDVNREVKAERGQSARYGDPEHDRAEAGSNTWALGPSRSASGNAMLLVNPHLSWGDTFYRYMEVHLVGPGYDLYGAPQIGFPTPVVGFNRRSGWGRTVNTLDSVDYYRLTVKDGQYLFDGTLRPFERETKRLKVRQDDGRIQEETLEIRRTVHGPVVYDQDGLTIAMRVAGLDRPRMLEQWFRMGEAQTLQEFQNALRIGAVPMWNANYADDQGHIMLVFNGLVPRRNSGDYASWDRLVPGDTSRMLWTDYLSFDELPKAVDPPSGFTQNANEPPWLTTLPPLDRSKYPAYVAPTGESQPQMRTLRSLRMITEDPKLTYEQLVAKKHSTRVELADKVLPDLLKAAGATPPAQILERWDRHNDVDSRGAVLFQLFVSRYLGGGNMVARMRVPYDPAKPLDSAYGLADPKGAAAALAEAAAECEKLYGSIDVKWGDVYRFRSGNADLPGNGGAGASGLFRTITYTRGDDNKYYASSGETIVCAIEFGRSQRANCVLGYGNATQPGSVHREDQLPLMVKKALHPVWRERAEVEQNLKKRQAF